MNYNIEELERAREHLENQIGKLANWILKYAPDKIEGSAVDTALLILDEWYQERKQYRV